MNPTATPAHVAELSITEADPMPNEIAIKFGYIAKLVPMERIRACVSAMEGLNPEALSDVVKALEGILPMLERMGMESWAHRYAERARTALANLKGAQ